jgi:hypothetical protein
MTAGTQIALGVIAANWGRWGSPRWSEWAASFIFIAQFVTIGLRAWGAATSVPWLAATAIVGLFLAAWTLPLIFPGFSSWLWREQVAPQSKVGRIVLGLSLAILPTIGVVAAGAGTLLSAAGQTDTGWMIVAVLAFIASLIWGHSTSHQLQMRALEDRIAR